MTAWEMVLFSIVQGIGEFLPISSSAHLLILKKILHLEEMPIIFDILLHIATLGSVFLFFRKRIISLLLSFWESLRSGFKPLPTAEGRDDQTFILLVLIATVFTGIIGVGVKDTMEMWETDFWVSTFFLVTATLLFVSQIISKRVEERPALALGQWGLLAIILGVAQGIGTLPGISRSGITIATLLILRFPRARVAEVSFILSIPAILGALVLELKGIEWDSFFNLVPVPYLAGGMVLTFLIGCASLVLLKRMLLKAQLAYFSVYLVLVALWGYSGYFY
jgi:undecaprenyl-diphosphatase